MGRRSNLAAVAFGLAAGCGGTVAGSGSDEPLVSAGARPGGGGRATADGGGEVQRGAPGGGEAADRDGGQTANDGLGRRDASHAGVPDAASGPADGSVGAPGAGGEWTRTLEPSTVAIDVARDPDGELFATGWSGGANTRDAFLAKVSLDGAVRWTRSWGTSGWDSTWGVAVDGTGSAWVAGSSDGDLAGRSAGSTDAVLTRFTPEGDIAWEQQWGTPAVDSLKTVAIGAAGDIFVGGYTDGSWGGDSAGAYDNVVMKLTATGTITWMRQWGGPGAEFVHGLAIDGSGNVFVAGESNTDATLTKLDRAGSVIWSCYWRTPDHDLATGVVVQPDGGLLVIGDTRGSLQGTNAGGYDSFLSRVTPDGTVSWTRQWGLAGEDSLQDVALEADGNLVVVGYTTIERAYEAVTMRLGADGTVLSRRQAPGEGLGLALVGDGTVLVSGGMPPGESGPFVGFVARMSLE